ncbi:GFA family protein [Pseudohalioglobus sediminis]|uniref:GFA family protein n=1 Tax=Pseudohalioglobus sediminis TaxID=2606449 RepID=A0A5B0X527_9GAMM|nr:GFA family protein [Pseudohalioglobus sediminis]KAA1194343.1 GFA family protein [Pseudohalioglobus sediminis]
MKVASCQCGQLTAACPDEHLFQIQCGCVDCQRRTGTPSSFNAYYKASQVKIAGEQKVYTRGTLSGSSMTFHFCPNCGSTVIAETPSINAVFEEDLYEIPVGCFFDSNFAAPDVAVWTCDLHDWFPAAAPKDFQMEEQQSSLEEIKETFKMLGVL